MNNPGRVTPVTICPNLSERRRGSDGHLTEEDMILNIIRASDSQISGSFSQAHHCTRHGRRAKHLNGSEAKNLHGLAPRIRDGNRGQLTQTCQADGGTNGMMRRILCRDSLPETGGTTINKSGRHRGNAKGSPQAGRNGTWAETTMESGSSEGEGGMRLSAAWSMIRRKRMLHTDDIRKNAFPDTDQRSE